jgi:uncharacterized phiE125 gp8 family phage protein
MVVRTLESPATEPVSVAELKTQLRIDHEAEDQLLARLISAARQATEAYCGRALITRRLAETFDAWPRGQTVALSWTPLVSVGSVSVFGAGGFAPLPAEAYTVIPDDLEGRLVVRPGAPAPARNVCGIEIDYRAGFGASAGDTPAALRQAVLVAAAALYERGGASGAAFPDEARGLARAFVRARR